MNTEKEDLGLSLSLGCSTNNATAIDGNQNHRPPLHFNLMPSSSSTLLAKLPFVPAAALPNTTWLHSIASSVDRFSEAPGGLGGGGSVAAPSHGFVDPRPLLKGMDVKRMPANATEDDEAGVSSPNSTISSVSGKRSEREITAIDDDHENERACSRSGSDEEDGDTSRKKLRLSKDQSAVLEESFKEHSTLDPKQKQALAKKLGLRPRQVEVWFQNRRARTKLKQTEVDCEFLKRCCEQLKEDNRRLQKEVQELRALKFAPQFYMQMTPPTTLTMCPSCERPSSDTKPSQGALRRGPPMSPWGLPAPVPIRPFDLAGPPIS